MYQYLQVGVFCNSENTFPLNPNRGGFYIGVNFFRNQNKFYSFSFLTFKM